jgi:hypothetical protein
MYGDNDDEMTFEEEDFLGIICDVISLKCRFRTHHRLLQ